MATYEIPQTAVFDLPGLDLATVRLELPADQVVTALHVETGRSILLLTMPTAEVWRMGLLLQQGANLALRRQNGEET